MTNLERLMLVILIITLLLACISLILAISANARYRRLYRQYDYFMRGKDAENLEDYFVDLQKHVERLEDEEQNNKDMFRILNRNIRSSFQRFGLIRYNAFGGMGGNQSFCCGAAGLYQFRLRIEFCILPGGLLPLHQGCGSGNHGGGAGS